MHDPSINVHAPRTKVVVELERDEVERTIAREEMELTEVREETVTGETGLLRATGPVQTKLADKLRAALSAQEEEKRCGGSGKIHVPIPGFCDCIMADHCQGKGGKDGKRCRLRQFGTGGEGSPGVAGPPTAEKDCPGCPDCSPEVQEGPGETVTLYRAVASNGEEKRYSPWTTEEDKIAHLGEDVQKRVISTQQHSPALTREQAKAMWDRQEARIEEYAKANCTQKHRIRELEAAQFSPQDKERLEEISMTLDAVGTGPLCESAKADATFLRDLSKRRLCGEAWRQNLIAELTQKQERIRELQRRSDSSSAIESERRGMSGGIAFALNRIEEASLLCGEDGDLRSRTLANDYLAERVQEAVKDEFTPRQLLEAIAEEVDPIEIEARRTCYAETDDPECWASADEKLKDEYRSRVANHSPFVLEFRVNDHAGIHAPLDRESAEALQRQLAEADPPPPRPPIIECRRVEPWTAPLLSEGVGEAGELGRLRKGLREIATSFNEEWDARDCQRHARDLLAKEPDPTQQPAQEGERCGGTGELWTKPPEGTIGSMKRPCPGCIDCAAPVASGRTDLTSEQKQALQEIAEAGADQEGEDRGPTCTCGHEVITHCRSGCIVTDCGCEQYEEEDQQGEDDWPEIWVFRLRESHSGGPGPINLTDEKTAHYFAEHPAHRNEVRRYLPAPGGEER